MEIIFVEADDNTMTYLVDLDVKLVINQVINFKIGADLVTCKVISLEKVEDKQKVVFQTVR